MKKSTIREDLFKISGDNKAILDLRDLSKVHLKNDNVQALDTKWDEESSAVTDRPTDNILESLRKMQVENTEELTYVLQVYARESTFGDKKYDCCRSEDYTGSHPTRSKNQRNPNACTFG